MKGSSFALIGLLAFLCLILAAAADGEVEGEKDAECPKKKELCDWEKLEKCRKANDKKFEECVLQKREVLAECSQHAEDRFHKCMGEHRSDPWAGGDRPPRHEGGGQTGPDTNEDSTKCNGRWRKCKRRYDQAKERCEVEHVVALAVCKESKECRDFKCLWFIKDCKPCPPPTTSTTTKPQVTTQPPVLGSCPADDYFGNAADLNVFLTGSDKLIYDLDLVNGDIEGRAAVNGGFKVKHFGAAQNYPCPDNAQNAKRFNLIVNGKMDYDNGQLFCGSSIFLAKGNTPSLRQEPYGAQNLLVGSEAELKHEADFDFASTAGYLQGVSDNFCTYSPGTYGYIRISQYSPNEVDKISIPGGNYLAVVNIKGSGSINFSNFQIPSDLQPWQVIFNVCGDNDVNISAFELNGHLLALNSDVKLENGHVQGNVYARSLVGSGSGQVNLAPCPN